VRWWRCRGPPHGTPPRPLRPAARQRTHTHTERERERDQAPQRTAPSLDTHQAGGRGGHD
jgi:hypothetical protein